MAAQVVRLGELRASAFHTLGCSVRASTAISRQSVVASMAQRRGSATSEEVDFDKLDATFFTQRSSHMSLDSGDGLLASAYDAQLPPEDLRAAAGVKEVDGSQLSAAYAVVRVDEGMRARVTYGDCICFTISPNEQHSALVLRLSRFRQNGPICEA